MPGLLYPDNVVVPLLDSDIILQLHKLLDRLLLIKLKQLLVGTTNLHMLAGKDTVQVSNQY